MQNLQLRKDFSRPLNTWELLLKQFVLIFFLKLLTVVVSLKHRSSTPLLEAHFPTEFSCFPPTQNKHA